MNRTDKRIFDKEYSRICKKLKKNKWKCITRGCESDSINSHLLQQNGILDLIAHEGHVIEVKSIDSFRWSEKQKPVDFKRISVRNAISLKLFCNKCDSNIFKKVETSPVDFCAEISHLLLSYRVICAEKRKKEQAVTLNNNIINSKVLDSIIHKNRFEIQNQGTRSGIKILEYYKLELENAITTGKSDFDFVVYKYPLIKIYCSAAFTPFETYNTPFEKEILDYVFIHVIPTSEELIIVLGNHKKHVDNSIKDYIHSWNNLERQDLCRKLTELFTTKVENWGLSPLVYEKINYETKQLFIDCFLDASRNYIMDQDVGFDLFENIDYDI